MAVNINTVYQKVLALANKEQRGYITPQEFNLLANQAQMEIFEEYFYDQNQADRNLKNSTEFSNVDEMLDEKISHLKKTTVINIVNQEATLPSDLYRLGMVRKKNSGPEVEQVTEEEQLYLEISPLTQATETYPCFIRTKSNGIKVFPNSLGAVSINYISRPQEPKWGYVVVNEKALYDSSTSTDFNLHRSEETNLVIKILELAGITINKPGLVQLAGQEEAQNDAQTK